MKANTQNNLQDFSIYIDGQLQGPTASQQALETARTIGHGTLELLSVITRPVASTLGEMATSLQLDIHDQRHGTQLRQEYYRKQRELATAALREEYELVE